jgi:hypothetical protein
MKKFSAGLKNALADPSTLKISAMQRASKRDGSPAAGRHNPETELHDVFTRA